MSASDAAAEYLLWPDYIVVGFYFISVLVIGIWVISLTIFLNIYNRRAKFYPCGLYTLIKSIKLVYLYNLDKNKIW